MDNRTYFKTSSIPDAGRGAFAAMDIKKDEIIETCPFIEIPKDDISLLGQSFLLNYYLFFGKDKERVALAQGYGSLYNHSDNPNAKFEIMAKEKAIRFTAIKDIQKDEEICFNYRGDSADKNPLWFEM